jgi:ribA/ribD-fused uncharacterized protein
LGHTSKENEQVGKFVFSQWYQAPFVVDGVQYHTAEHWMMAGKALLFDDRDTFQKIVAAIKPGEVKELGRQIRNFHQQHWDAHKYEIVKQGSIHKFANHQELKDYLLNTGDRVLVEASPVDVIWGIGLSQDARNVENPHTWKGQNLLGFALMETRDFLRGK